MDGRGMDERARTVAAHWDLTVAAFDDEPDHGLRDPAVRRAWAGRLAGWLPGEASDVLDAGCGTGTLSVLLAEDGHRVTGVDLAPGMVAAAEAKAARAGVPAAFLTGDAADPPTGGRRFDVVLARHLLWTLPDPHAALRAWTARLRPGGRLVLVEGRWEQPAGAPPPYGGAAGPLPWQDGVGAPELADAVRAAAASVLGGRAGGPEIRVEPLDGDPALWGRPVADERYALTALIPGPPGRTSRR
ncbi:class I SAM-dependent methyltransferase [Streptomyces sp. NPDC049879]|uniref:class I SAM-dependent methyltransferase n=1 Tax=Streptomyces sp. NPDC049879 TaxID=3365598 RepID=UPI0037911A9B